MKEEIKVKDWISYEDAGKYKDSGVGGLGGWFNWETRGQRWADFLDAWKKKAHPYLEALRESIIENNIRFGGDDHQNSETGMPLFSDGTVAHFSYRAWGDLLAAVWSEKENKDYSYMDFYMTNKNVMKYI